MASRGHRRGHRGRGGEVTFRGIIAGKKDLVQRVRRHPLFRALRVDKLTICALEATLSAYLRNAIDEIPALRMLRTSATELASRADGFLKELRPHLPSAGVEIELVEGESLAGGGSTPTQSLRTPVFHVRSDRYSTAQLEKRLRRGAAGRLRLGGGLQPGVQTGPRRGDVLVAGPASHQALTPA